MIPAECRCEEPFVYFLPALGLSTTLLHVLQFKFDIDGRRVSIGMDSHNRQTASSYINNLLLSRGLLRNGITIDFAQPEKAEGGLDPTMSQVMNLVHDMILRRDVSSILDDVFPQKYYKTTAQDCTKSRLPEYLTRNEISHT